MTPRTSPSEDIERDRSDDDPSLGQEGGVVNGELEWSLAPAGPLKSAEAFRARGIPACPRRRARRGQEAPRVSSAALTGGAFSCLLRAGMG
jgi:hypothetical protein